MKSLMTLTQRIREGCRQWLEASPWRMEIAKLVAILAISYFIMFRREFGFTETPYNFF